MKNFRVLALWSQQDAVRGCRGTVRKLQAWRSMRFRRIVVAVFKNIKTEKVTTLGHMLGDDGEGM